MKLGYCIIVACLSFLTVTVTVAQGSQLLAEASKSSQWGTAGIRLNLNFSVLGSPGSAGENNKGDIEFDCGRGDFNSVVTDRNGGFIATGTFTKEGGPYLPTPNDRTQSAKYFGNVINNGQQIYLLIVLSSAPAQPKSYLLDQGFIPRLHKCL